MGRCLSNKFDKLCILLWTGDKILGNYFCSKYQESVRNIVVKKQTVFIQKKKLIIYQKIKFGYKLKNKVCCTIVGAI